MPYADWVTAFRLAYSRRKKQARRMKDSGSLLWPTAKALTGGANSKRAERGAGGPDLQESAQNWPTPMAGTPAQNGNSAAGNNDFTRRAEELAAEMALNWSTPRASDGTKGGPNQSFGAGGVPLAAQTANWTTPQAHDVTARGSGQVANAKAGNACLARDAQNWPTPAPMQTREGWSQDQIEAARAKVKESARNGNGFGRGLGEMAGNFTPPDPPTWTHGVPSSIWRPISRRLFQLAISRQSPIVQRRWLRAGSWRKRRLNPLFVEWLMGWPPGHALCACSATAFILWQRHMRGALSALPTALGQWTWEPPLDAPPEPAKQLEMF